MKHLWLSLRTILRFRTYTAINIAGLALSLACVFILVRYIHQERTVNHFIPELDRTCLMTVVREGDLPRLGDTEDRNHDPNFRNPYDHPEVEAFSRFLIRPDDYVSTGGYNFNAHTLIADSLFFSLVPYPCEEGTLELKPNEALLTRNMARRMFGEGSPVGRSFTTSTGQPVTVAGVVGTPSTKSSFSFDVVLCKELHASWAYVFNEVVRLHRPEDLETVNRLNASPMKLRAFENTPIVFQLTPLADFYLNKHVHVYNAQVMLRGDRGTLRLMALVAVLILLVGMFNYVNLYTVVMLKRGRELGVKKVMGAGRGQIFTQLYAENVLLNTFAVCIVWFLVEATRIPVERWFEIPVRTDTGFDLALSAAVIFLLPLLTAIPPFWRYTHAAPMRSLSQVSIGGRSVRTRAAFLFLQYVITFCLVVAAIYLSCHLRFLLHTDVGYRTQGIVECVFWKENPNGHLDYETYKHEKARAETAFAIIEKRLDESPLVEAWTYGPPPYNLEGDTEFSTPDGTTARAATTFIDHRYMDFFGFRITDGRGWGEGDEFAQYKAIVNRAFLRALHINDWRTASVTPSSRLWWSVNSGTENEPYEIVGVMEDFFTGHLGDAARPIAFLYNDTDRRDPLYVRLSPGHEHEGMAFLKEVYDEAVGQGDFHCVTVQSEINALLEQDHKVTRIIVTFALIAIGISCLGLFAMSLYDIRQRYREIALRKVHGARPRDLYRLLLRRYVLILGMAFAMGGILAWAGLMHYMEQFSHRAPLSAWIFLAAALLVAFVALLTLFWQIRRTTRINPAEVMKSE